MIITKKIMPALAVLTFFSALLLDISPVQNDKLDLSISNVYALGAGWEQKFPDCTITKPDGGTVTGMKGVCNPGNAASCVLSKCIADVTGGQQQ